MARMGGWNGGVSSPMVPKHKTQHVTMEMLPPAMTMQRRQQQPLLQQPSSTFAHQPQPQLEPPAAAATQRGISAVELHLQSALATCPAGQRELRLMLEDALARAAEARLAAAAAATAVAAENATFRATAPAANVVDVPGFGAIRLAAGWNVAENAAAEVEEDRWYFYNAQTKETRWEPPLAPEAAARASPPGWRAERTRATQDAVGDSPSTFEEQQQLARSWGGDRTARSPPRSIRARGTGGDAPLGSVVLHETGIGAEKRDLFQHQTGDGLYQWATGVRFSRFSTSALLSFLTLCFPICSRMREGRTAVRSHITNGGGTQVQECHRENRTAERKSLNTSKMQQPRKLPWVIRSAGVRLTVTSRSACRGRPSANVNSSPKIMFLIRLDLQYP